MRRDAIRCGLALFVLATIHVAICADPRFACRIESRDRPVDPHGVFRFELSSANDASARVEVVLVDGWPPCDHGRGWIRSISQAAGERFWSALSTCWTGDAPPPDWRAPLCAADFKYEVTQWGVLRCSFFRYAGGPCFTMDLESGVLSTDGEASARAVLRVLDDVLRSGPPSAATEDVRPSLSEWESVEEVQQLFPFRPEVLDDQSSFGESEVVDDPADNADIERWTPLLSRPSSILPESEEFGLGPSFLLPYDSVRSKYDLFEVSYLCGGADLAGSPGAPLRLCLGWLASAGGQSPDGRFCAMSMGLEGFGDLALIDLRAGNLVQIGGWGMYWGAHWVGRGSSLRLNLTMGIPTDHI